ncbi:hypothetical protein APED_30680 [Acanthopleuribacter pedis]|uniref:Uncharacterized protein n=1 Tax=Acanthopleuribacter pedis TaxID=442870 RepID=A0A8J7U3R9_9BACT|nr:hypothetical protein [Acanthopleuribacter pedis]
MLNNFVRTKNTHPRHGLTWENSIKGFVQATRPKFSQEPGNRFFGTSILRTFDVTVPTCRFEKVLIVGGVEFSKKTGYAFVFGDSSNHSVIGLIGGGST